MLEDRKLTTTACCAISRTCSRAEKLNVIGVNTDSRGDRAYMRFTVEVSNVALVQRVLGRVNEVEGVMSATLG